MKYLTLLLAICVLCISPPAYAEDPEVPDLMIENQGTKSDQDINPNVTFLVRELRAALADGTKAVSPVVEGLRKETRLMGALNMGWAGLILFGSLTAGWLCRRNTKKENESDNRDDGGFYGIMAVLSGCMAVGLFFIGCISFSGATKAFAAPTLYLIETLF